MREITEYYNNIDNSMPHTDNDCVDVHFSALRIRVI